VRLAYLLQIEKRFFYVVTVINLLPINLIESHTLFIMIIKSVPQVCVVLLNYEGSGDTIACLDSLRKASYKNFRIVVVDNASTDHSVASLNEYFYKNSPSNFSCHETIDNAMRSESLPLKYTLIQSQVNGGYGAGNNIGIKYALKGNDTDYILIINNDTIVEHDFIEPMVQLCEDDKTIGIASGKIYYHDRPDVIWFNGGRYHPCTAKVEHVNFGEKDTGQKTLEKNTFITGCLWLIPRKTIQSVGLINEDYFMYIEDLEYCRRVLSKGFSLQVSELSKIYHKVGSSTGGRFSDFSVYWRVRNMNLFIREHVSSFFYRAFSLLMFNVKMFVNICLEGDFYLIKAQIRAIRDVCYVA
jgi:GT2 family glycosyltransferase